MPTTTQPRRLIRRFGTGRRWRSEGPGRYVPLTPLGVPLTRGGMPAWIERRRADRTMSRPAGWYTIGPPLWRPTHRGETAREAAQQLHTDLRQLDLRSDGLAKP